MDERAAVMDEVVGFLDSKTTEWHHETSLEEKMADFHLDMRRRECEWKYDDDSDYWETGCGNEFQFEAEGPTENKFKFCPYCGDVLKPAPFGGEEEGEGNGN